MVLRVLVEQVERNDQLSMELLRAANAQLATLERSDDTATQRGRIRAVATQLADQVFVCDTDTRDVQSVYWILFLFLADVS